MPDVTGSGDSLAAAFRAAMAQASLGRPRPSYRAHSPLAQWRQLTRTRAGRRALELAGVAPSPRTVRRWRAGTQQPRRGNAEAIGRAYEGMRAGGIPDWVKRGQMEITGRIDVAGDVRDRGSAGAAPFRVDLRPANNPSPEQPSKSGWDVVEEGLDLGDDDLEELIAEEIITADIDTTDTYHFPGGGPAGGYTVKISG